MSCKLTLQGLWLVALLVVFGDGKSKPRLVTKEGTVKDALHILDF